MGDGGVPITVISSGRDFGGKTSEELEAIMDVLTSGNPLPEEPLPVATPEPIETPKEEAAPPEAPPEPPTVEPEIDLSAVEKEGEKIAREKLEAQLDLVMAHNSRLAGKIGFLEQKLNSAPASSEPYEPQTQQEVDRLTQVEQRLNQAEERRTRSEVSQAIADALGRMDGPWTSELASEIAEVAPKYADQIKAANESTDPELARQIATAVATVVKAEASQMAWQTRHDSLVKQKEAATTDMAKAKKAQTPSGSGGVPPPQTKPKTIADMTSAEADAWLRENVR